MPTCNHTEGPRHSCAYVEARNRRIPAAVRYADGMWGAYPPLKGTAPGSRDAIILDWCADWNTSFHHAMNQDPGDEGGGVPLIHQIQREFAEAQDVHTDEIPEGLYEDTPENFKEPFVMSPSSYEYLGVVEENQ